MSNLLEFLNQKANEKVYDNNGDSGGGTNNNPNFIPEFALSEQDKPYYFSVLDLGAQFHDHWQRWPNKAKLCRRVYYGEPCEECEKETGRVNVRKWKDKNTGEEVEKEVAQKNKPIRKQRAFLYVHNNVGGTRASRNNPEVTYETSTVMLSNWPCGEANTQSKLEKDRNIKNILQTHSYGCLSDTVFCMSRTKVKDEKGKEKDQNNWPTVVPPQAKVKYTVPGKGEVTNPVSKMVVPTDVREKWDNMTLGQKIGLILEQYDPSTVDRAFWEGRGVEFPPRPERKEEEENTDATDDSSLDNE